MQLSQQSRKVNYAAARRALAHLQDIPPEDWKRVCEAAGLGVGKQGGRSRYCAAWLWAELTGGDWHLAPALLTQADQEIQREVYRTMQKTLFPQFAPHLRRLGRRLLAEGGIESASEKQGDAAVLEK